MKRLTRHSIVLRNGVKDKAIDNDNRCGIREALVVLRILFLMVKLSVLEHNFIETDVL